MPSITARPSASETKCGVLMWTLFMFTNISRRDMAPGTSRYRAALSRRRDRDEAIAPKLLTKARVPATKLRDLMPDDIVPPPIPPVSPERLRQVVAPAVLRRMERDP